MKNIFDQAKFLSFRKRFFSKITDGTRNRPIEPILYQLGLHFLRLHDGKFNHPIGHIVNFVVFFSDLNFKLIFVDFSLLFLLKSELGF